MDKTYILLCMLMMGLGNLLLAQNYHFLLMLKNRITQTENMIDFVERKSYAFGKMKERQRRAARRKQRYHRCQRSGYLLIRRRTLIAQ